MGVDTSGNGVFREVRALPRHQGSADPSCQVPRAVRSRRLSREARRPLPGPVAGAGVPAADRPHAEPSGPGPGAAEPHPSLGAGADRGRGDGLGSDGDPRVSPRATRSWRATCSSTAPWIASSCGIRRCSPSASSPARVSWQTKCRKHEPAAGTCAAPRPDRWKNPSPPASIQVDRGDKTPTPPSWSRGCG